MRQLQQNLAQEQTRLAAEQQSIRTRILDQRRTLEQQKATADNSLRQQTVVIDRKFNDQRKQIMADEAAARSQHREAIEECRRQFRAAAAQLAEESDQIKTDYRTSLDQFNNEIEAAAKRVRETSWRQVQAERRALLTIRSVSDYTHGVCSRGHKPTMPWRFRKVFRAGPMRGWISRTGIGYSWGLPGFRIGVAADGRRYFSIGIPGTGLYFYKYFRRSQSKKAQVPQPSGGQIPGTTTQRRLPSTAQTPPPGSSSSSQANQPPWWKQKNLP